MLLLLAPLADSFAAPLADSTWAWQKCLNRRLLTLHPPHARTPHLLPGWPFPPSRSRQMVERRRKAQEERWIQEEEEIRRLQVTLAETCRKPTAPTAAGSQRNGGDAAECTWPQRRVAANAHAHAYAHTRQGCAGARACLLLRHDCLLLRHDLRQVAPATGRGSAPDAQQPGAATLALALSPPVLAARYTVLRCPCPPRAGGACCQHIAMPCA